MTKEKNAVIVFAKAPVPGRVKTRLCPPLSPAQAAGLYRAFILDTLEASGGVLSAELHVAYDSNGSSTNPEWLRDREPVKHFDQEGGDLGERLIHAFGRTFSEGAQKIVVIGSDTPQITSALIEQAIAGLDRSDVVFGPAEDGGYYLVALKKPRPELFRKIPWSTAETLAATLRQAHSSGLKSQLLPSLPDMDTFADVAGLARTLRLKPRNVCPVTRSALKTLISKEIFDESSSL